MKKTEIKNVRTLPTCISRPNRFITRKRKFVNFIASTILLVIFSALASIVVYHTSNFIWSLKKTPDEIKVNEICSDKALIKTLKSDKSDAHKARTISNCYDKRSQL